MAVINRQYEALNTMFLNGHSPCVLDGKLCNPMYYACVHGDWKLAAVLRVLYLVPLLREREQKDNADSIDDSLMAASIEGNHEHVLMTLLLLNAPLSNAGSEIVIEEGQISTHDFPVPLLKAFKLKNSNTFHVLIQGCFYHSIVTCDGSFERITMQLKRVFVSDVELGSELETSAIAHQSAVNMETVLRSHVVVGVPANAGLRKDSKTLLGTENIVTLDTLDVVKLTNKTDSTAAPTALQNVLDDPISTAAPAVEVMPAEMSAVSSMYPHSSLSSETHIAHVEELRSNIANNAASDLVNAQPAMFEQATSPVMYGGEFPMVSLGNKLASKTSDPQFVVVDEALKVLSSSSNAFQHQQPASAGTDNPLIESTVVSSSAQFVTSFAIHQKLDPMITVGIELDAPNCGASVAGIVALTTNELKSSYGASPEDGHYVVKESVTLSFDKFELEIDAEYRSQEPVTQFNIQDVLPVVRIEDRIGHEFLNACKLGLHQVLISIIGGFSVDSIFRCSVVAQGQPMHLAVLSRSLVTVQILFQWKPTLIFDVNDYGCTPMHVASRVNFHAALSMFLSSNIKDVGTMNQIDREGHSCLTMAVQQGAVECVELLVKTETDVLNVPSTSIPSALELSLTSSIHSSNVFRRLFNLCSEQAVHGFQSSHDNGLLQVAVKHQRMHSVCTILQRMGEGFAQMRDATGRTAVEIAATSQNKTLFNLLTQRPQVHADAQNPPMQHISAVHAPVDYFDDANDSKLYLLRSFPGGKQVTSTLIDQINLCVIGAIKGSGMLQLFQKIVASGNAHLLGRQIFVLGPQKQCTCLHLAAGVNSVASIQFVLDNCSRSRQFLDLHNSIGMTACAVALIVGHTNCAKLLLQQGSRIVSDCISGAIECAMSQRTCNLLHICAKHCHDSSVMEQLLDAACSSHILALNDSKQSLLHVCAHVNNIHAYNAIVNKAPYAISILINHRDDLGNTALHICASHAGGLPLAHALLQGGSHTHLRNYDGDLPHDIAGFMGNMDVAQLTRTFKSEELVNRADFQLQCSEYASKVVENISHDKSAELPNMCKSYLWIGSWLSIDFLSSELCAEKAASVSMATSLSQAGFCAISCPTLVQNLLLIMLKTRKASITVSLGKMFPGCNDLVISSFLVNNFSGFVLEIARETALEASIFTWVVKYWTRLSVCDSTGSNALHIACQTQNVGFFIALIQHIETMASMTERTLIDVQLFSCLKYEITKALSSRNYAGQSCLDVASGTAVVTHVMNIISHIAYKPLLRLDIPSKQSVFDVFPPRHLSLISFGMFEVLFEESDFDVSTAQESRDSFGRCLVANACIAGHAASVSALLEKGFSPSVVDFEGLGILQHAVLHHRNDVVYFITKRFPQKLFELDSSGSCILHLAIRNGSDHECLSTLKLLEQSIDNDAFVGLCWHSDDSKSTVVEATFSKGKYNSGMFIIQNVMLKCGRLSANPIHMFDRLVTNYLMNAFKQVAEFNAHMVRISSAASVQNSLTSFLNVFCNPLQSPQDHDDTLQPQTFDSATSSLQALVSDLKFSSFFSGMWVCLDETFSDHYLVSDDKSLSRASLGQIFSAIYDNPAFSKYVCPSVSEAMMAHSLRLNCILQDGVPPSDCERMSTIQ